MNIHVSVTWVGMGNLVTLVHSYKVTWTCCNAQDLNVDSHTVALVGSNFTGIGRGLNQVRIVEWMVTLFLICVVLYSFTDERDVNSSTIRVCVCFLELICKANFVEYSKKLFSNLQF
jgi:hypothetical protein